MLLDLFLRLIILGFVIETVYLAQLWRSHSTLISARIPGWIGALIDADSIVILISRIIQIADSRDLEFLYHWRWSISWWRSRTIGWFSRAVPCYLLSRSQIEGNRLSLGDRGWACLLSRLLRVFGIIEPSKFIIPCIDLMFLL